MSRDHEYSQAEITEIFFTNGDEVEHGEYWILNNPTSLPQYYIYYDNPTWINPSDPGLSGRTGIEVSFNYSDSNVEIAQATFDAVNAAASVYFWLDLNVDVITVTNLNFGAATDADEVSSPFEFNVINQGKNESSQNAINAVDEKVFLVYGDNKVYGETTRTGGDGVYQFGGLKKGNYSVYVPSKDTTNGTGSVQINESITIDAKKSQTSVPTITILN